MNTATVTAPAGTTDLNQGNNSATDTNQPAPQADLGITKTDGTDTYTAGTTTTYTLVVTNGGPSNVVGATVADTLPAGVTSNGNWSCVASAGSSCAAASGTGSINTTVNLLVGGTATFLLQGTISPAQTTDLINTATVTAGAGQIDPNLASNRRQTPTPWGSASRTGTLTSTALRDQRRQPPPLGQRPAHAPVR